VGTSRSASQPVVPDPGYHRRVPNDPGAATLLRTVGLLADGPIVWGRPIPARGPGVFVVELPAPLPSAPIEVTRVGKWVERVETLRLDGVRPTSKELAARLSSFWLPSQPVVFIGASETSVAARIAAMARTALGDRRPSSAGHWLHALRGLETARVWWASTTATEEYEDALMTAFVDGVPPADLQRLPSSQVVLPFANLRRSTGERRVTGLTGSLLADTVAAPAPPTRVVSVPDGDADGARGEPAVRRPRAPAVRAKAPVARPAASSPSSVGGDPRIKQVHLTTDGIGRLQDELDILTTRRRPEVIGRIRAAKELGDLKENADYSAAREEQSFLEGRIQAIEAQLRDAVVIQAPAAGSRVGLGSVVTVETDGERMRIEIVGTTESSPKDGRISGSSPVGRALLSGSVGDEVTVQSPSGPIGYRIVAID
jgi:transcription elongation factor GreA